MDKKKIQEFIEELQAMSVQMDVKEENTAEVLQSEQIVNGQSSLADSVQAGATVQAEQTMSEQENILSLKVVNIIDPETGEWEETDIVTLGYDCPLYCQVNTTAGYLQLIGLTKMFHGQFNIYSLKTGILIYSDTPDYSHGVPEYYVDLSRSGNQFVIKVDDDFGYEKFFRKDISIAEYPHQTNPFIGISIKSAPNKIDYKEGEKFDPTGMKVIANYSFSSVIVENFSYNPTTALYSENKYITVESNGATAKQSIKVTPIYKEPPKPEKIGTANETQYDYLHYYKNFAVRNSVSVKLDLLNKTKIHIINALSEDNAVVGMPLFFVHREDDSNNGYGRGINLSICERIRTIGNTSYYIDSIGDWYKIENNIVQGMKYTSDTPEEIKNLTSFSELQKNGLKWLTDGTQFKAFNNRGYLVYLTDTSDNYYKITYNTLNQVTGITDWRKKDGESLTFSYINGYLNSIKDNLNNQTITLTHTKTNLTKIAYSTSENLIFTYSDYSLTQIESFDGYVYKFAGLLKITTQSLYSAIPDGGKSYSTPTMSEVTITLNNLSCTIDYKNEKTEYYTLSADGYVTEFRAVNMNNVTEAENYTIEWVTLFDDKVMKQTVKKCDKSLLNKKSYIDFTFSAGETIETTFDKYNRPYSVICKNRYYKDNSSNGLNICKLSYVSYYTYGDNMLVADQQFECTLDKGYEGEEMFNDAVYYTYNGKNQIIKKYVEISKGADTEEYEYNERGLLTKIISYNSSEPNTKFYVVRKYDDFGRLIEEETETGQSSLKYTYESFTNRLSSITLPNGCVINYSYDGSGNIIKYSHAGTKTIENNVVYTKGEMTGLNGGDNALSFTYDNKRRIKNVLLGSTNYETYVYSTEIYPIQIYSYNLIGMTNANGDSFTYKQAKNMSYEEFYIGIAENSEFELRIDYNSDGTISQEQDKVTGINTSYSYDNFGRLKLYCQEKDNENIYVEAYSCNQYGSLSQILYNYAVDAFYDFVYSADIFQNLTYIEFMYDDNKKIKTAPQQDKLARNSGKVVYVNDGSNDVKVLTKSVSYLTIGDRTTNLPSKEVISVPKVINEIISYKYDDMSNITEINRSLLEQKKIKYTYDKFNRLIREDNQELGFSYYYTYDDYGNITKKEYMPYNNDPYTIAMLSASYTYSDGRLVSVNGQNLFAYDSMGNPKSYRGNYVSWSKGNQMTRYQFTTFEYDGSGRRIAKNGVKYYYDSQGRLLRFGDMIFFYDEDGIAGVISNGEPYVYIKDIQGNVTALLDKNGNKVVRYIYDAWGNHKVVDVDGTTISSIDHIGNLNPIRYRGYYYDTETGLYYLQTRYYDPEAGRFISRDATSYADPSCVHGLNLYIYCNNNPVMYVDPTGQFPHILILGVIGLVAGLVGQFVGDILSGEWSSWQEYVGACVGGFVTGALSTICGPVAASVLGSLATDATTLGLNYLTGQETRTGTEILFDMLENATLSMAFAYGSEFLGNVAKNSGGAFLKPLLIEKGKITLGMFIKELTLEIKSTTIETIINSVYYKIKSLMGRIYS